MRKPFLFQQFAIYQDQCAMKVGTDSILLGAWAQAYHPQRILDIGTGTGVLALILAQRYPQAQIVALEIDTAASRQAQENVGDSPWTERVDVINADFLKYKAAHFDLLISNPPYYEQGLLSHKAKRNQARHTGALPHFDLLKKVKNLMSPLGCFCFVLPREQAIASLAKGKKLGLFPQRIAYVRHSQNKADKRWLVSLGHQEQSCIIEEIILKDEAGYTPQYRQLTQDFHLIKN